MRPSASKGILAPHKPTLPSMAPVLEMDRHSEIERHIQPGALKVLVYSGQAQPGSKGGAVITAAGLAGADIVLTSYDTLKKDLHHCPDGPAGV
jgi:E3 ubiquitin-protein ligase SHPRH